MWQRMKWNLRFPLRNNESSQPVSSKATQQARKLDQEIREQLHLVCPSLDWSEVDFSSSEYWEYIAQTLFTHWFVDFEFPNETEALQVVWRCDGAIRVGEIQQIGTSTTERCRHQLFRNP
jgi:hypothetical protein